MFSKLLKQSDLQVFEVFRLCHPGFLHTGLRMIQIQVVNRHSFNGIHKNKFPRRLKQFPFINSADQFSFLNIRSYSNLDKDLSKQHYQVRIPRAANLIEKSSYPILPNISYSSASIFSWYNYSQSWLYLTITWGRF